MTRPEERSEPQSDRSSTAVEDSDLRTLTKEFEMLLSRSVKTLDDEQPVPLISPASLQAGLWRRLADNGWLVIGNKESGINKVTCRQLIGFGRIWGQWLVPAPYVPTLLVNRWRSAPAGPHDAFTYAVPAGANAVVPFAQWPGVRVVAHVAGAANGNTRPIGSPIAEWNEFCPSLPLTVVDQPSVLGRASIAEIRALAAAEAVGSAERCLAVALEYADRRQAFGQPISRFQAVQRLLVDMHSGLELARTAVLWAADVADDLARADTHSDAQADNASQAAECIRLCRDVVTNSIQVHGGMGFTWDQGLHWHLRHILALRELTRTDSA